MKKEAKTRLVMVGIAVSVLIGFAVGTASSSGGEFILRARTVETISNMAKREHNEMLEAKIELEDWKYKATTCGAILRTLAEKDKESAIKKWKGLPEMKKP